MQQGKSGIQDINSLRAALCKAVPPDYAEAAKLLNSCEPLVNCEFTDRFGSFVERSSRLLAFYALCAYGDKQV